MVTDPYPRPPCLAGTGRKRGVWLEAGAWGRFPRPPEPGAAGRPCGDGRAACAAHPVGHHHRHCRHALRRVRISPFLWLVLVRSAGFLINALRSPIPKTFPLCFCRLALRAVSSQQSLSFDSKPLDELNSFRESFFTIRLPFKSMKKWQCWAPREHETPL